MIVLIEEIKDHIKGYGFTSDISGTTYCGIPKEDLLQYEKVYCEFEEDPDLEPYICPKDLPTYSIPRGTLKVYGILKDNK